MQKLKKVWDVVSTVIVALVVVSAIFLMGSRLMGYRVFSILSGSMEPVYSVGDLIYVQSVDPKTVEVGDVITFVLNEDLVVATHRVVRIDAEKSHFYTKGDVNEIEDGAPVHFNNLIGIPKFSIPLLGYVSDFIQNPPGMYIVIVLGSVLLVAVFLPDFLKKKPQVAAQEITPQDAETMEENARLKAELEALKAQLNQNAD